MFVRTDVSRWGDMDHLVGETVRAFGRLDIMVNNAGVLDGYVTCLETSEELFDKVIAINLKGVFFGCKRVLPEMVKTGYGKIVNISSIAGLQSNAGGTPYTVSKHGVIGLTRELAHEYGPKGVRVNAICPGSIAETNLRVTSKEVLGECSAGNMYGGPGTKPAEYLRELIPLGGRGIPKDIALAAVFLASPDSDYVNGHALVVDGGLVVR
jgi:NAD(P)-dependent dehydrogenase (short-subunit alcohol dehydrogenase family)